MHGLAARAAGLQSGPGVYELGMLARPSLQTAGCSHENITVEAGKTYLLRIINSASLTYQVGWGVGEGVGLGGGAHRRLCVDGVVKCNCVPRAARSWGARVPAWDWAASGAASSGACM